MSPGSLWNCIVKSDAGAEQTVADLTYSRQIPLHPPPTHTHKGPLPTHRSERSLEKVTRSSAVAAGSAKYHKWNQYVRDTREIGLENIAAYQCYKITPNGEHGLPICENWNRFEHNPFKIMLILCPIWPNLENEINTLYSVGSWNFLFLQCEYNIPFPSKFYLQDTHLVWG